MAIRAETTRQMQAETSIILPAPLAIVAEQIAKDQNWSLPDAIVFLVKRGVEAQVKAEAAVEASYEKFMQAEPENEEPSDDLIRTIFGPESIA